MEFKSPFSDKSKFEEYLNLLSKNSNYGLATEMRDKKMSNEELEIYKQKYKKFSEKYELVESTGGAGMTIKSNNQQRTPYKLYMNPGMDTLEFAELIMNKCNERKLDYALKVMSPTEVNMRCERLVLYGSSMKDIGEFYDIINTLTKENNSITFGKPPIFADNIDGKIGFGYDSFEHMRSYNNWMPNFIINKATVEFSKEIISEVPKEYISEHTHRASVKAVLRDFPEFRERFRLYLNEAYTNAIKDIPESEQFFTFDKKINDKIESNKEKTTGVKTQTRSIESLPAGAEWRLNSKGEYKLIITDPKNGSKISYSPEVASKKYGVKPPNQQQQTNQQSNQLPAGAEWRLNSKGEYKLIITDPKNGSKISYSPEVASKKYGIKLPNYEKKGITLQKIGAGTTPAFTQAPKRAMEVMDSLEYGVKELREGKKEKGRT